MRSARIAGLVVAVSLAVAGIGWSQTTDTPVQLKDVSIERAFDGAAVTVKTSGPPRYEAKLIDSPTRLVIDLAGASYGSVKSRWASGVDPVKEVRASQWRKGIARVVVEMTRSDIGYRIDETPEGLVVAVENPNGRSPDTKGETAKLANGTSEAPKATPKSTVVAAPKPVEKPAPVPVSTDTSMDAPKATPRPAMVAAAEPAEKPAPVASTPVSKEPPAPVAIPVLAAATSAPTAPVPTAPARQMIAQATTPSAQAPPPPPTPASGEKLISLDFKDADVVNLLRILAAESGRNIVAGDDVKGRVSISLKNVTWEQALDTILEVRGLAKVEKDGVIRVVSLDQLTKEKEAIARVEAARRNAEIETRTKLAEAQLKETELATRKLAADAAAAEQQARGPLREEVIRLSYADPEDVARTLQGILGIPPEGVQAVPATIIPSVPATPTVVPAGGGPPNPALGNLPAPSTPYPPPYGPATQPAVSVSQEVLAKGITVRANKATNSIFIRHYEADLERIKKLIREQLDVPLPQIKIEARMEILDRSSLEAIGIQWGGAATGNAGNSTLVGQGFQGPRVLGTSVSNFTPVNPNLDLSSLLPVAAATGLPTGGNLVNLPFGLLPNASTVTPAGGIAFGIVGTRFNINLALQALATLGKTRTLAHPEIVTVENNKAAFTLGEEIPYATVSSAGTQVQFKEAVLKLEVTPTVIRERIDGQEIRKVKMTVIVENNSRGDVISPAQGVSVPIINRRKAETQVLVREGDRLVIGGVTQNVQQKTIRKLPLMGDVPILGWLFKQREDFETGRELVVFMTPSILKTDGALPAGPGR
ncbi:MAG TPA: secretin N-terminal domain-containing protein [Methylomirabilota bacterium]|nr:secretin N-terminal domain-containing protein [Methylomirabilota bacterium]